VAAANAALGSTLTPTSAPTNTPIPPTDTPIPPTNTPVPPTNTPVPQPTRKSSQPAPTAIPTPTPALLLPVGGGDAPHQVWAPWALGMTALLCGVLLWSWNRPRKARVIVENSTTDKF
jgi:hypothetical protein